MKGACLAALVALVAAVPVAAAGGPRPRHTAAGTARATGALLRPAALGGGWRSTGQRATPLACKRVLTPQESDLVETGRATGPLLSHGAGAALAQSARVYRSAADANAAWSRTLTDKLVICLEQKLEASSSMMSPVSVANWYRLAPPRLLDHVAGIRVVGRAKVGKRSAAVYLDLFLLGHAKTMTTLVLSSLGTPVARTEEHRIVRIASRRLLAQR